MKTLIVPMAGKSTRFPNGKPKWMLTHPRTNGYMVIESLSGLNLDFFDQIIFVATDEQEEKHCFADGLNRQLEEIGVYSKSRICLLPDQTNSQSETVYRAIKKENVSGYFYIKDSDSYFTTRLEDTQNIVSYGDLSDQGKINASSKSYIEMDNSKTISNIIEKRVVSSTFSVGGYGFESSEQFCSTYESLSSIEGECYVSHIIYEMMLAGETFKGHPTKEFEDYGTIDDWNSFREQYKVIFTDLDGTLLTNTSKYNVPLQGQGKPIQKNIDYLNDLKERDLATIIITTSRSESERSATVNELRSKGILYDQLIMGLPHCKRYLVNDFASSNPYPSAIAVNLNRNEGLIEEFVR